MTETVAEKNAWRKKHEAHEVEKNATQAPPHATRASKQIVGRVKATTADEVR